MSAITTESVGNRSADRGYIRTVFVPLLRRIVDIMVRHGASIEWCGTRASMLPLLPQVWIARACIRFRCLSRRPTKEFLKEKHVCASPQCVLFDAPNGCSLVKRSRVLCDCAAYDHMGSASKQLFWRLEWGIFEGLGPHHRRRVGR